MTFTYTDPSNSDEDHIRFLTGDTVKDGVSNTDEELAALLAMDSNVYRSALRAARGIRARIAKLASSRTVNSLTTSRTTKEMDSIISDIKEAMRTQYGGIGVFGLSTTDQETIADDETFIQSPFAREGYWKNNS